MSPEQRRAIVGEAMSWVGTPYHHHARIKTVGVDCAQILCSVYEAGGVIAPIDPGQYARDWHLHRSEEQYLAWMERYATRYDHLVRPPVPGDVALFRFGRCFSHSAIVVDDGLLVHAYIGRGVILSRADEAPLDGRPVIYWEPK